MGRLPSGEPRNNRHRNVTIQSHRDRAHKELNERENCQVIHLVSIQINSILEFYMHYHKWIGFGRNCRGQIENIWGTNRVGYDSPPPPRPNKLLANQIALQLGLTAFE